MKEVHILVGTRPNFIKITQFEKAFAEFRASLNYKLIHTGQHSVENMSDVFFNQLNIKVPDFHLNISNGSPNTQIANIMLALEKLFEKNRPDLLIVVGDVNSTLAGALVANKMKIPLAHLESGLRSKDFSMPEEYNRVLTDAMSDYHFITELSGRDELLKEGKDEESLFYVGNTMIDTLTNYQNEINASEILLKLDLEMKSYCLMTMHRPGNVDTKEGCEKIISLILLLTESLSVVFPIHPRTLNNFSKFGLKENLESIDKLIIIDPLDYFSFQKLIANCSFVITDSGGIQEETTFLQIPCLTLRPNTERPITVEVGTNTLVDFDLDQLKKEVVSIRNGSYKKGQIPVLWDGKSTKRIVSILKNKILAS